MIGKSKQLNGKQEIMKSVKKTDKTENHDTEIFIVQFHTISIKSQTTKLYGSRRNSTKQQWLRAIYFEKLYLYLVGFLYVSPNIIEVTIENEA